MLKFGNKFVNVGGTYLTGFNINYNPLNLPPNTIRVRTLNGNSPIKDSQTSYETAILVDGTNDVYDVYKSGTSFEKLLSNSTNVVEVIGADTTNVTNMSSMFEGCRALTSVTLFDTSSVTTMYKMFHNCDSLTSIPLFYTSRVTNMSGMFYCCLKLPSVPLFDTSSVTDMGGMFYLCSSLTIIPLFNTTKVTSMGGMFRDCTNVKSGALALYQQASTQTTPPTNHYLTFNNCGTNTQEGAAELAQIPRDWKSL